MSKQFMGGIIILLFLFSILEPVTYSWDPSNSYNTKTVVSMDLVEQRAEAVYASDLPKEAKAYYICNNLLKDNETLQVDDIMTYYANKILDVTSSIDAGLSAYLISYLSTSIDQASKAKVGNAEVIMSDHKNILHIIQSLNIPGERQTIINKIIGTQVTFQEMYNEIIDNAEHNRLFAYRGIPNEFFFEEEITLSSGQQVSNIKFIRAVADGRVNVAGDISCIVNDETIRISAQDLLRFQYTETGTMRFAYINKDQISGVNRQLDLNLPEGKDRLMDIEAHGEIVPMFETGEVRGYFESFTPMSEIHGSGNYQQARSSLEIRISQSQAVIDDLRSRIGTESGYDRDTKVFMGLQVNDPSVTIDMIGGYLIDALGAIVIMSVVLALAIKYSSW